MKWMQIKKVVELVLANFYVDDMLKSFSTESEARKVIPQLLKLLRSGDFHLTKLVSNRAVLDGVPEKDRLGESDKISALGLPWDLASDSIGVKFELVQKSCTRRGILSMVSQIFDPLGFIQPFLLPAKILLQELSVNGLGWDDEVSKQSKVVWKR